MSIAPRLAQCTSRCTRCAAQSTFTQWWLASPSTRTSGCPHTGHFFGNFHRFDFGGRFAMHRTDHLGNDVAGAADDHGVAGPDVFARDVVLVVQRRHPDVRAADEDGLEDGEGRRPPGAADADLDVAQERGLLLGRELVRDRPPRRPRRVPHLRALAEVVDLGDDTVDLVAERVPVRLDALAEREHRVEVVERLDLLVHREAERLHPRRVSRCGSAGAARPPERRAGRRRA